MNAAYSLVHKLNYLLSRTNTLLERVRSWSHLLARVFLKKKQLLGATVARGGLVTVVQLLTLAFYVAQPTTLNWFVLLFCLDVW